MNMPPKYRLSSQYHEYRKTKFDAGGAMSSGQQWAAVGTAARMASGIINSVYTQNDFGARPIGADIGTGALSGAAMGTSVLPGWGTAIGAVVGAGYGAISGSIRNNKAHRLESQFHQTQDAQQRSLSNAAIAQNPSLTQGNIGASYYADGGEIGPGKGLWSTNKQAYVDSTLNANKNLDWVQRLYEKNAPSMQIPGQPGRSTHFMADDGNGYVFPTAVRENGSMKYLGDSAEDYAHRTHTGIQFPSKQGMWFANNGYKTGTGVNNSINSLGVPYNDPNYKTHAMGGRISAPDDSAEKMAVKEPGGARAKSRPLAENYLTRSTKTEGGSLTPLSNDSVAINGPSHEAGGVQLPDNGAEVEGGETMKGNFVFSDRLGFADEHKRLASAIGKIQKKGVMTPDRVNSVRRMQERENQLALSQEYLKHILSNGAHPDPTQPQTAAA